MSTKARLVANLASGSTFADAIRTNTPAANSSASGVIKVIDSVVNTNIDVAASANTAKNAYDRAIDANTRASSAQTAATSAYSNAVSVAATDASTKAATAYSNAVSIAATDASTKAATAYSNATSYADTKAATAYSNATSYAATIAATAYSNAVSTAATDASTKAATAYSNATTYAASIAATAYSNAISVASTDATTKAATAYSNAVSVAATDASTKAATAYSNATSYAATIAATAYSNAVSVASTDASTKAATAYTNAVAYAASNTYVNNTFAPKAGPTFTGTAAFADVTISGNLTASGTTTYINTTNLNIGDNQIILNADLGAVAPTEDAGIVVNRGSSANVSFLWDETNDRWASGNTYVTGTGYFNGTNLNSTYDATLYVTSNSSNDWGVYVAKPGYDYGLAVSVANTAAYGFGVYNGNWAYTISGNGSVSSYGSITHSNAAAFGNTTITGYVTTSSTYKRSAAGVGYLDGSYSSIETTSTTGPIYCIGGSYAPTSNTLGNMYGIGYNYGNGGVGYTNTWGMYVAAGGSVGHFLDAAGGIGYATGSYRAPIFYDKDNTSYYIDPASTSVLKALTVDGGTSKPLTLTTSSSGPWALQLYRSDLAGGPQVYASDATTAYWSGTVTAVTDMRAPVFYDHNNTGYYIDAAGTSTLNTTTATTYKSTSTGISVTGTHWLGAGINLIKAGDFSDSSAWTSSDFGIGGAGSVTTTGTSLRPHVGNGSNGGGLKQTVKLVPGATYTLAARLRTTAVNSGDSSIPLLVVQTVGGSRNIIDQTFDVNQYDGTPTLNRFSFCHVTFTAPASNDNQLVSVEVGFRSYGSTHSVLCADIGLYHGAIPFEFNPIHEALDSETKYIGGALSIGGHLYDAYNTQNPRIRTNSTGAAGLLIADSGNNFRAQLYGDGTNYGFLNGVWAGWDLRKVTSGALFMNNDSTYYLRTDSDSLLYRVSAAADMRSPAYYDKDDTNYYIDPASTTTSLQVAGAVEFGNNFAIPNVEWSASSTSTGMVIISLPGSVSNYGMIHAVIDIYEYSGNQACSIIVGGHNWNSAWYNYGAQVQGYTDKPVRVGYKDGQYCIVVGSAGSSWSYGQVRLRKITNGSYYNNQMNLGGAYTISQTATESFTWVSADLRTLTTPTTMIAYGSARAPLFYDVDNTSYYVDPASTSVLNGASFGTITSNVYFTGTGSSSTNAVKLTYDSANGLATFGPSSTGGSTTLTLGTSLSGTYAARMTIDNQGRTTTPYQPYSWVRFAMTTAAGQWQKITGSTSVADIGGNWSTANNRFTAPIAGRYMFIAGGYSVTGGSGSERYALGVAKNGSLQQFNGANMSAVDTPVCCSVFVLDLAASDYLELQMYTAAAMGFNNGSNHSLYVQVYLLG